MGAKRGGRLFFSELRGQHILTRSGQKIGRLQDITICWEDTTPTITGIRLKDERQFDSSLLERYDKRGLWLHVEDMASKIMSNSEVYVSGLLDKQIVDIKGRKLVRVNDIELLWRENAVGNPLQIAAVDIGVRGIFRRLGLEFLVQYMPDRLLEFHFFNPLENTLANMQLKLDIETLQLTPPDTILLEELENGRMLRSRHSQTLRNLRRAYRRRHRTVPFI